MRCTKCRAYINPFVKFVQNGTKWQCNFCPHVNNTESYYYAPTNEEGVRSDMSERGELNSGTVDFVATHEYMNRPPMPPTFVFIFDVSNAAVDSGYIGQAAHAIRGIIEEGTLPGGERTRVCFLAYDKNLYYFNLRSTLKQPQMLIMPQQAELQLPIPEDLLVNLTDSYDLVLNLLESFENYFVDSATKYSESNFVSGLQAANMISKAIGGKILLF